MTFANAAVGIAHVGLDGRMLHLNEAFCHITCYSQGELRRRIFRELMHPDDMEPDWAQAHRLLDGEIMTFHGEAIHLQG